MNNTEYLALEQPEETEFYDIEVANRNMKKIDDKFKKTDEEKCVSFYSVCNTAADVATKIVDCPGFVLKKGSTIKVESKKSNKAGNPTYYQNIYKCTFKYLMCNLILMYRHLGRTHLGNCHRNTIGRYQ